MGADLHLQAFDIETTGFDAADEVTVVGIEVGVCCRVCVQTGGRPAPGIEARVREQAPDPVRVSTYESEASLLVGVQSLVDEYLRGEDALLVAYNGETWNAGFDLPFLRTRYAAHDLEWPFHGLPYADLLPIVRDLFNTTSDGDAHNDLDGAYEVLCPGDYGALDPFEDSQVAVEAFESGELAPLVMHNVADIKRTSALATVAERYCSKSDFDLKSLTPTVADDA